MKVHGWCRVCRRIRRVNITSGDLVRQQTRGLAVVAGICDECRDKER